MQPKISFCLEWKMVSNLMRHSANACTTCVEATNLTGMQLFILEYLYQHQEHDVFQRDLERKFNITRSTASKVVNLMVQKGFIERQSVPYDARLKKLVLTDKASSIVALLDEDRKSVEETLTKGFTDEELEQLHGYLVRLKENVNFV